MEYTIKKVAKLTGVSTRTLRYYDEIGLIRPKRITSSGYRIYGEKEIDMLQQILFYREMKMPLQEITALIHDPAFDVKKALKSHRYKLLDEKERLERLIQIVDQSLIATERKISMKTEEKFAGFKENWVKENERKYGQEIRKKYGDEIINESNAKLLRLSETDFKASEKLNESLFEEIRSALAYNDGPFSQRAKKIAELHQQWLTIYLPRYSKDLHRKIVQMYVEDSRFSRYYEDKCGENAAKVLYDAVMTNV